MRDYTNFVIVTTGRTLSYTQQQLNVRPVRALLSNFDELAGAYHGTPAAFFK